MNLESSILNSIRLAASPAVIWRNQCGAAMQGDHLIRYGIGNPGGSDLIGLVPVKITMRHVGHTLGRFVAAEVKTKTGVASPAQLAFIRRVTELGGIGGIVTSPAEFQALICDF